MTSDQQTYVFEKGARDLYGHDRSLADVLLDFFADLGSWSSTLGSQQIAGGQMDIAELLQSARKPNRMTTQAEKIPLGAAGVELTSTILTHWVPLPAPGPPRTKMTLGSFALVMMRKRRRLRKEEEEADVG